MLRTPYFHCLGCGFDSWSKNWNPTNCVGSPHPQKKVFWEGPRIQPLLESVQLLSCVRRFVTQGLQHIRLIGPSPTPGAYSNSYPLSQWCHPTISASIVPFSSHLQAFPAIRVFSSESVLHIRWPKYWSFSFSISPSNEYSGLISFRIDWFDRLAVQGTSRVFSNTRGQKHQFFST